ncbi:hypothetical protein [Flammeovirga agarivorans]|uniref:Uncharacterized protein n=1 Tax=Flammeovirga agarivorans TaxID=2726742 RepID=A0A7X8SK33_9BACT|nr:hypothetical protein [Flammeovirga agarivorans]NLR91710.1 hypothetical protein [Flammeovirga agarivorans]
MEFEMTFLALNRHKLKYFFMTCMTVGFLVSEFFYLFFDFKDDDITTLLWNTLFCFSIGVFFSVFIFLVVYFQWYYIHRLRFQLFNIPIVNDLKSIGFNFFELNKDSSFSFSEILLKGECNGYNIIVEENTKGIQFMIYASHIYPLDTKELNAFKTEFKHLNLDLEFAGVTFQIKQKDLKEYDVNRIKKELIEITDLLKIKGFLPAEELELA